jgi:DNA helicase II / ATP-dependent DNA helicase PcrA
MDIDYRRELNDRQYLAATTVDGPLLIIAGAGSGKTRVITFRIAYMLDEGIPQSAILALTFTNKAAREMGERIKELTRRKLSNLTVGTFHAFGVKILRERINLLGYRMNFSIYDESDRYQLIKNAARELKITEEAADVGIIGSLFSNIKTGRVTWDRANDMYLPLYQEYQSHLKLYNAVDFDDLIVLPIKLFEENPAALEEYREKFKYIMVDEFQDTSLLQYRFMKLLAGNNVCVVGDDDQSIYSWRGASYENILRFERDFPEVMEIKLEQNYRSTNTILEAANGVIRHNKNRKDKALWSGQDAGKPIEVYFPENEGAESEFIARTIKTVMMQENRRYDEFGILIRTNNLTRSLEEALLADAIPYRVSGGTSFFQRSEVKDIVAYLRVIANPDDDVNLLRIINTPKRGIGRKTIEAVTAIATRKNISLYSSINALRFAVDSPLPEAARADLESFANLIEYYRGEMLGHRGLAGKLKALVENIDYWGYLVQEYQKNEKAARWKYMNVESLIASLDDWEKDPDNLDPSLYTYLNRITLMSRDDMDDEEKGKVNLMTIHSAKGLEFPVVFIAACEDGIIPHARALEESPDNIEEERRLFYVAITRARNKLYITACHTRKHMRETVECQPSPFIEEIPVNLLEYREDDGLVAEDDAEKYFKKMKERFARPATDEAS